MGGSNPRPVIAASQLATVLSLLIRALVKQRNEPLSMRGRWLLLLIGLLGCHTELPQAVGEGQVAVQAFEKRTFTYRPDTLDTLKGSVWFQGPMLGRPADLLVVGSYLIVGDNALAPALHLFQWATQTYLKSTGQPGEGPGEFRSVAKLLSDPRTPTQAFWVYDLTALRFTRYRLSDSTAVLDRQLTQQEGFALFSPEWVGDSLLISPAIMSYRGRMAVLNARGQLIRTIGPTPTNPKPRPIPLSVLHHAYYAFLSYKPTHQALVLADFYTDRLELYDLSGRTIGQIIGPENFPPVFEVEQVGDQLVKASTDETRHAYIDVVTTPKYIFALYSGKYWPEERSWHGFYLHVFDWSGNLVKAAALPVPVLQIALLPDGQTLLGIVEEPEPALYQLTLPPLP